MGQRGSMSGWILRIGSAWVRAPAFQTESFAVGGGHRKIQLDVFLLDLVRLKVLGEVNGVVDGSLRGRINGHMCGWLAW